MEKIVNSVLGRLREWIAPAVVYALYPVTRCDEEGTLHLENGLSVNTPGHQKQSEAKYLAAVVCTIGPALEAACKDFSADGDSLRALFLDAAGVAALEALSERAFDLIRERADSLGLSAGCRFAPGCMDFPMERQAVLYRLADGERIGVHLNSSMVMEPNKSVSFFVMLMEGSASGTRVYKCRDCELLDCQFRVGGGRSDCQPEGTPHG